MTLVGACSICSAPALNSCAMCGRLVCRAHYDVETGLCTNCSRRRRGVSAEEFEEDDFEDDFDE